MRSLIPQITDYHISLASCHCLSSNYQRIILKMLEESINLFLTYQSNDLSHCHPAPSFHKQYKQENKRRKRSKDTKDVLGNNSHYPPPGVCTLEPTIIHVTNENLPKISQVVTRPISKLAPFSKWLAAIRLPRDIQRERMMVPSSSR